MPTEWALLDGRGEIVTIFTSSASPATIIERETQGEYTPKRLDEVSQAVCKRYRYWDERP